jgi:hypothetical protein
VPEAKGPARTAGIAVAEIQDGAIANAAAVRRREASLDWLRAIASAKSCVDHAAAEVLAARTDVKAAEELVHLAELSETRTSNRIDVMREGPFLAEAVESLEGTLKLQQAEVKSGKAVVKRKEATLKNWYERRLKDAEAELEKARAAAAAQRALTFPRVAPDVALRQLGALPRLKHFEVPTRALEEAERHVCKFRDLFNELGERVTKWDVPHVVVVGSAGIGKTTLLRYLQQTADTVRYGAELRSDTNWVVKGWTSAPCSGAKKDAVQSPLPPLRHVFVGFATFKAGAVRFNASIGAAAAVQRRCAWHLLYDAGFAPDWTPNFDLDLAQAAEMVRAKISAARDCTPDEVAIVFLIDEATRIPEDERRHLQYVIAEWQRQELAAGRLSLFIVSLPLSVVAASLSQFDRDDWIIFAQATQIPVPPLVEIPRELEAEVKNDAHLSCCRKLDMLGDIRMAAGHPGALEDIAQALADYQEEKRR